MLYKGFKTVPQGYTKLIYNNKISNTTKEAMAIVWLIRELRIYDQASLRMAPNLQNQGIKVLPI